MSSGILCFCHQSPQTGRYTERIPDVMPPPCGQTAQSCRWLDNSGPSPFLHPPLTFFFVPLHRRSTRRGLPRAAGQAGGAADIEKTCNSVYLRRIELRKFNSSAITQCSSSMDGHTIIALYTVSVGLGIAYSELKAMRRPDSRDKQVRFPRFFFVFSLQFHRRHPRESGRENPSEPSIISNPTNTKQP